MWKSAPTVLPFEPTRPLALDRGDLVGHEVDVIEGVRPEAGDSDHSRLRHRVVGAGAAPSPRHDCRLLGRVGLATNNEEGLRDIEAVVDGRSHMHGRRHSPERSAQPAFRVARPAASQAATRAASSVGVYSGDRNERSAHRRAVTTALFVKSEYRSEDRARGGLREPPLYRPSELGANQGHLDTDGSGRRRLPDARAAGRSLERLRRTARDRRFRARAGRGSRGSGAQRLPSLRFEPRTDREASGLSKSSARRSRSRPGRCSGRAPLNSSRVT